MKIVNEYLLPICKKNGQNLHWRMVKFIEVENRKMFECFGNEDYREIDIKIFDNYQKYAKENYEEYIKR